MSVYDDYIKSQLPQEQGQAQPQGEAEAAQPKEEKAEEKA